MIQRRHRLLILISLGFVLCAYGLMWGLPNLFDFAQDSVVPYGSLAQIRSDFDEVTAFRYPPFHFWILKAAFLPARALLKIPAFADNPKLASTLFILTARLVSMVMALGTMVVLYRVGKRLWDERVGLWAALIFILSPVTLYYAKNANLDIPYVFWLAVVLLLYVRVIQENRSLDYLYLGLAAALAVCTKDQAYAFLILMPGPIMLRLWRGAKSEAGMRRRAWQDLAVAFAAFVVPFALIHNIIFDPAGFWQHVRIITGPGSEGWREFSSGPIGQLRLLCETLLRVMGAMTPAGLALCIVGLVVGLRRDERRFERISILIPVIGYHVFFPGVIGYIYPRFVLPMMLVLALFAGRGVIHVWEKFRLARLSGRAVAVALLAWIALAGLSLDVVMGNYSRYKAQMWLEENAPGLRVVYVGDMRDMPRFNKPLDPTDCEPGREALAQSQADMIVLSFDQQHPVSSAASWRVAALLRRHLGDWGRVNVRGNAEGQRDSIVDTARDLGYEEFIRFQSPVSRFVPEVAESVNRTIVILVRRRT